jgi:hypothetical protein
MKNSNMTVKLQETHEIVIRSNVAEDDVIRGPLALWLIRYYPNRLQGTLRENNLECHDYDTVARAIGELRTWCNKQAALYS